MDKFVFVGRIKPKASSYFLSFWQHCLNDSSSLTPTGGLPDGFVQNQISQICFFEKGFGFELVHTAESRQPNKNKTEWQN